MINWEFVPLMYRKQGMRGVIQFLRADLVAAWERLLYRMGGLKEWR